jgi:demethoxyubiquinone hydroxylase (CLK1/Coq7/Cat5 family)
MIAAIWARFYGWILGAGAALITFAAIYARGRSTGKAIEQKKANQIELTEAHEQAETVREVSNVQAEVSRLPADAVHERLRDKWTRPSD